MTKISSSATFFYKIVFPLLWFGGLASMTGSIFALATSKEDLWNLLAVAFFGGLGFLVFKLLAWDLVDEVYDGGDILLVRNRGEEEWIPLSNIRSVKATVLINPTRITLSLIEPCRLGGQVTFSPNAHTTILPFAKNPIAEDLIARSGCARDSWLPWLLQ